ncbi:LANO_0F00672g1_1 [Lachancea nothofagi CBS 11611]|uniref:LANO_0F00672g1_1 n=1 Tax=Lachancea nothofagi CBS 11611 TaxID=1266666 RepID=A0A1G4K5G9_9SACH|nr:LANO_0F00672g1_1 [Lachancea nothofagi CBS 11611]
MDASRSSDTASRSSYDEHQAFSRAIAETAASGNGSAMDPDDLEKDSAARPQLSRSNTAASESHLQRVLTSFFSDRTKSDRKQLVGLFFFNHLLLALVILSVFSLYWGAMYKRTSYYHKVDILAVIQDDGPAVQGLPDLITKVPGNWQVYNSSYFQQTYDVAQDQIDSEITKLVHNQHFWMSLNIKPNASNAITDSLQNSAAKPFNSTLYFETVYESGRDPTNMKSSILPLMLELEAIYQEAYSADILPKFLANASQSLSSIPSVNLAQAGSMSFKQIDYRPFSDYVLLGPLQVGLIYCILLTFFQLLLFIPMHVQLSPKLKVSHMFFYRYATSFINYFFMSLFFNLVSLAFQVDFTKTYGRGGFMVAWMSSWLLMAAVGGANENMLTFLLTIGTQYAGFWMIFWVVFNISPSFYPMDLTNNFYRYGYMTPIFNGVQIFRVIYLDLYPGHLGRNFGILIAWIVLNTALFPVFMKYFLYKKKQEAMKAAAAQNQAPQ